MPEKLKEILQKVIDWWNKFTSRQKTIIIGLAATVIFAFALILYATSQPQYTALITCENAVKASEVQALLDGANIKYKPSADGLKFSVESSQYTTAVWALGAAGYGADEYTIQQALNGSISTTASDKEKLSKEAYESKVEKNLTYFSNIKSADVLLNLPEQNGTLIREKQEASAYIRLELDGTFTSANAANVARAVATWLGNSTTANITILDTEANLLFAGGNDYSMTGVAGSMQELKNQGQVLVANQVKNVLLGTQQFSQVEVTCNLSMDYASYEETIKEYSAPDGRDEGMLANRSTFESESTNSGSAIPGTDSNNEQGYVSPDSNDSSATQNEKIENFLPNEKIQYKEVLPGIIQYADSSMAIALIRYREYREEDVRRQGLLDGGITWEEYKLNNSADIKLDVDEEYYNAAANATGIPREKITILSYESPRFVDRARMTVNATSIMSVVMLIVIVALLAFVVLRSMGGRRSAQQDEELSVESLLQSSAETVVEDIDLEAKSETRRVVEKFVDENPEAAATLLRNWLSEEW